MRRRAQCRLREGGEKRPDSAPAQPLSRHVSGRVLCHVRPRWRRSYGERVREGEAGRVQVKQLGEDGPRGRGVAPALIPQHTLRPHRPSSRPSDSWARCTARRLGREERAPQSRARGAGCPSPSSRPSRRVPSPRVLPAGCPCESAAARTFSDSWSLSRLPFPPRHGAGPYSGPRMQNVINTVKGKALEVAEYLTPVLKVSRAGLATGCQVHAQLCRDQGSAVGGVTVFSGRGKV